MDTDRDLYFNHSWALKLWTWVRKHHLFPSDYFGNRCTHCNYKAAQQEK